MTELLESLFEKTSSSSAQKKAWNKWLEQGFPNKKSEAFRYVSLKKLHEASSIKHEECHFDYEAPEGVTILPLSIAKRSYAPLLEKRYANLTKKQKDPFFFLNQAMSEDGLFIYVPPHVRIEEPLSIKLKIPSSETLTLTQPRLEVFLGKGAELTTTFTIRSGTDPFWSNANINVTAQEGALYSHYDDAGHHPKCWDFLSFQAELKEKSRVKVFSFGRGAAVQRRDFAISLDGEHSEVELNGMALLNDHSEGHVHIRIDHVTPNTRSHQFFKHVLADRSRSSFEGKIFVEKEAQKTEAYQLNNNLILSEKAVAFSKPNLEIFADDVKASHGATVSKPRADELFYLRSRGLSLSEAQDHLVRGFCRELIQDIPLPSLCDQYSGEIDDYLSAF